MKRVALCVAILLVIFLLCTVSLVTVSCYQHDFTQRIQDLNRCPPRLPASAGNGWKRSMC